MSQEDRSRMGPDLGGVSPVPPSDLPSEAAAPVVPAAARVERRVRHGRWSRAAGLSLVVLMAIAGVVYWWVHSRLLESTDNAYVVGNITPISAQVGGAVVALFADDNMIVQPGDPIAQIDPIPFQVQVDQALSEFKQAIYDAQAAVVNVGFFQKDRKSLLEGAEAKQAEAEQGVDATEYARRTRGQILAKDRELLASLKAQRPGLEALMVNARDYYDRFNRLAIHGRYPGAGPRQPRGDLPRCVGQAEIPRQQHRRRRPPGARQRVAAQGGGGPAPAESEDAGQCRRRRRTG